MTVDIDEGVDQIDSIVLGESERTAAILGLTLLADAKYAILMAAQPTLDRAIAEGRHDELKKAYAARAGFLIMQEVALNRIAAGNSGNYVEARDIANVLDNLCAKFPHLYPFCPRP